MSTASKITLASTTLGAIGIVIFVHYAQERDRSVSLNKALTLVWRHI